MSNCISVSSINPPSLEARRDLYEIIKQMLSFFVCKFELTANKMCQNGETERAKERRRKHVGEGNRSWK